MILTYILNAIQSLLLPVLEFIPENLTFTSPDLTGLHNSMAIVTYILTVPIMEMYIGSLLFWLSFSPSFGILKFIYRKIPGVN